ncbi:hypothetical protein GCM10010195_06850 [Kitasatospora griseola]|nr:hypothetical protein GCM10010195_06850 [Kitasatospora griseola]
MPWAVSTLAAASARAASATGPRVARTVVRLNFSVLSMVLSTTGGEARDLRLRAMITSQSGFWAARIDAR